MNFQNKTALITGGASGLGFLCGKCLAREGANVMLVDIDQEALDRCVAEIAAYPANAAGAAIDVRDYQKVCTARDEAVARFGSIDILINCAGVAETRVCGVSGEFQDISIDVYDFGIDVNLKGALYFDHAVLKQMAKQQSGVIIHLGFHHRRGGLHRQRRLLCLQIGPDERHDQVRGPGRCEVQRPLRLCRARSGADPARHGQHENSDGPGR